MPLKFAPTFDRDAALWAAQTVYTAAQLILYREHGAEDLDGLLPSYAKERTPGAHLSGDLLLRFLPDLITQLKLIDAEDPLYGLLESFLDTFPYPGIRYRDNPVTPDLEGIKTDPCLLQLFTKHHESEWIHLRILEAALHVKANGHRGLQDRSVLKIESPATRSVGYPLSYQLRERIPLTRSKNDLLGNVIEEGADHFRANISLEWWIELYAIAIGSASDVSVQNRLWQKMQASRKKLMELKKLGKKSSVAKYLYKRNWKKKIDQQVQKWSKYRPYYYEEEVRTFF